MEEQIDPLDTIRTDPVRNQAQTEGEAFIHPGKQWLHIDTVMRWLEYVAKKQGLCDTCKGLGANCDERNPIELNFRSPCRTCKGTGKKKEQS